MAPAILHDYLYWYQPCTREEADALMLVGMIDMEVGTFKVPAIYETVRQVGQSAFDENRKRRTAGEVRTCAFALAPVSK